MKCEQVRADRADSEPAPSLPSNAVEHPLVVERLGKRLLVVALTDIDGTIVNEDLPDSERAASIVPARMPVRILQEQYSIPVGIVTGRSYAEARWYREQLNGCGPIICENGAALAFTGVRTQVAEILKRDGFTAHQVGHELLIVPSRVTQTELLRGLESAQEKFSRSAAHTIPVTTSLSAVGELAAGLKSATLEDAARSAERVASIFVMVRSPEERKVLQESLAGTPLQLCGNDLPHIMPKDCDKGAALTALHDLLPGSFGGSGPIDGVLPIVFGNAANDIPLFRAAEKLGGKGVLIARSTGGYAIDPQSACDSLICSSKPVGFGIAEVLPSVIDWLLANYAPEL